LVIFGLGYWGWLRRADGTTIATRWVTLFFVPVLPLETFVIEEWGDEEGPGLGSAAWNLFSFAAFGSSEWSVGKAAKRIGTSWKSIGAAVARAWCFAASVFQLCAFGVFVWSGEPVGAELPHLLKGLLLAAVAAYSMTTHYERLGATPAERDQWAALDKRRADRLAVKQAWAELRKRR